MSAWPGKYVIGLTGNIATGKSEVRIILEHLGALGIDADKLAHQVLAPDSAGYQAIVDLFGSKILSEDSLIDRARLAAIVFAEPDALRLLEARIHPVVGQEIDRLINSTPSFVIVIEAIKLIEAGLDKSCDTLWVTFAPEEVQLARLIEKRGMSEALARQRINAQPPQKTKMAFADVIINNSGTIEETRQQVISNWKRLVLPVLP
jgi:dephospho-CoA kinase